MFSVFNPKNQNNMDIMMFIAHKDIKKTITGEDISARFPLNIRQFI